MDYSVLGFVLIVLGVALHLWMRRRQFYRRNAAGVETFRSFGGAVLTNVLEGFTRLVVFLLIFAGILLLLGIGQFVAFELGKHHPIHRVKKSSNPAFTPHHRAVN